ncbi:MAG: hypothetical protein HKN23_11930 [Verrucomicrobiales bacterium]|nr:hypothetical protein [Verrucomicrobiales bacterium]
MRKLIPVFALAIFPLSFSSAQDKSGAPPSIDVGAIPEASDEDVVIPIPQEIFNSLDKLGVQNWKQQVHQPEYKLNPNRSRTALIFGLQISEGFILIQAKDKDGVTQIGRDVIKLAGALGVEAAVDQHAFAIIEGAGKEDWASVRQELDKTRKTVIDTMRELRDDSLADLVTVGGWLGGTRALSAALKENYSKEGSDLLNQPHLLSEVRKRYKRVPETDKRGKFFNELSQTLKSLDPLMRVNNEGLIAEDAVGEINQLTHGLSDAIYEGK